MKSQTKLEKDKIKLEKLAKRIEQMPACEYNKFMQKLIAKVRLLEAKEKDLQGKSTGISSKPQKRDISVEKDNAIVIATACGSAFLGMVAAGALMAGMDSDYLWINSASAIIGGFFVGSYLGSVGTWSYENRPLSKVLDKIRLKTLSKKLEKTNAKLENKKYLQELLTKNEDEQIYAKVGDIVITKQEATEIMARMFEDYLKEHYSKDTEKIKIISAKEYLEGREKV